jgi:hypothetical protein
MCSDDPPTCYHFRCGEEERRKATATTSERRREFHLILADTFHARHLMSGADNKAYERFSDEIGSLHGDALLRRKLAFDQLPRPTIRQRELHLAQHLCLVAALIHEFGSGKWEPALKRLQAQVMPTPDASPDGWEATHSSHAER